MIAGIVVLAIQQQPSSSTVTTPPPTPAHVHTPTTAPTDTLPPTSGTPSTTCFASRDELLTAIDRYTTTEIDLLIVAVTWKTSMAGQ